jgi:antitoxin PrlF
VIRGSKAEHENRPIQAVLDWLDKNIQAGVNVRPLPEDLAKIMREQAQLGRDIDLNDEIEGDVDL